MTSHESSRHGAGDDAAPERASILRHDSNPGVGDHIGEAAGGISGVLAGAAIGAAGGPIGTIIGGLAGALGGWWAGRTVSEAATRMTAGDSDTHYRNAYEGSSDRFADRSYDDVRPAYQIGHLAAMNPDYADRDFDTIEPELQRGWNEQVRARHGDWQSVSRYARAAYVERRAAGRSAPEARAASDAAPDATDR